MTVLVLASMVLAQACDNVALGTAASASGTFYPGCPPTGAVDGAVNAGCGWAGQGLQTLTIDLGRVATVSRVLVHTFTHVSTTTFYDDQWTLTHSLDGTTWTDFLAVEKVGGAGTLGTSGISIADGDPGTGVDDPDYMAYEFGVAPTELQLVRYVPTVGDADGDSNVNELVLCAVSNGGDDGAPPGEEASATDSFHGVQAAGCADGQYYDLLAQRCRSPAEASCACGHGGSSALGWLGFLFFGWRRRARNGC